MNTSNTQAIIQQLNDLMTQQIQAINKATQYLNDIKSSVESNDLETLKQLIQHNNLPLSQIEEQEKARFALIKELGFEQTKKGFTQCVTTHDDTRHSLSQLDTALNLAMKQLHTATTVSDLLISKNKQRVKQSLSILTGASLQTDPTYSSTGNSNKDHLIRPLAIA